MISTDNLRQDEDESNFSDTSYPPTLARESPDAAMTEAGIVIELKLANIDRERRGGNSIRILEACELVPLPSLQL